MKVYIDGENCRKGLARVLSDQGLIKNERTLINYRLRDLLEDVLASEGIEICYYASKIKLPQGYTPSKAVLNHINVIRQYSRKWIPHLSSQGIEYIKAGSLKVKSSKKCANCGKTQDILQEKGVDVRIAIDALDDVYSKNKKHVVIMSSDTDLCPAMHRIQSYNAHVTYVCFADAPNRAIAAVADETVTISISKARKYLK
ncbi:MAG: NYN domain-containing protein [Candidatus Saccharimonadales bacterium]